MSHKLYVTCWRHMALDSFNRLIAAPMAPSIAEMWVEIEATSKQSDAFPEYTTFISIKPTTDCAIAIGVDPEADPEYHFVEAGEFRFYGVEKGHKIAVVEVLL